MLKKFFAVTAIVLGSFITVPAEKADGAIIVRRVAPVRRIAARTVFPPYPVARAAAYRPYYRPYGYGYGGPWLYGPGVSIGVGF